MPANDRTSNWAYLGMAALAWNLKAWFALLMPARECGFQPLKLESWGGQEPDPSSLIRPSSI